MSPTTVFEELLVNALVHRDYLISAPIRIFIFDNRIEIVSPDHLPYRGLGSGIKRALEAWPKIAFTDDREGCLFTAMIHRVVKAGSGKSSGKTEEQILGLLSTREYMTDDFRIRPKDGENLALVQELNLSLGEVGQTNS